METSKSDQEALKERTSHKIEESVDALLPYVYEAYKEAIVARTNVRLKASFLISVILTLMGTSAQTVIGAISTRELGDGLKIYLLIVVGMMFSGICSIWICGWDVFMGSKYNPPRVGPLLHTWAKNQPNRTKASILSELISAVPNYRRINDEKERQFNNGFISFIIFFVLLLGLITWATLTPTSKV